MLNTLLFGFAVSLIIALALGPLVIRELKKFHARQSEREEGPESHKYKAGTPTMGGILILTALVVSCLIFNPMDLRKGLALFLTLGHGIIGFLDDSIKAVKHRNLGLTAKQKLAGQFVMAAVFCFILKEYLNFPTTVWIPFTTWNVDLGMLYYVFVFVMIVGTSNAVNLTDGLDGLAAGSCAITSVAYVVISVALGYVNFAVFSAALTGACLGFLFYNQHPAKMFMGDTGSLALGGALAAMAILTKTELLLIIAGGLYVIEALSVIIQVVSFKTRGVRVFKMSPIHHHFELSGWSEVKVVTVFWSFSAIMAILSIFVVLACK
ncbi:phospho-N-acetylmuramoyl-pentapeptide-transferase [Megasphaera hexanoica]|jgi:phospho-N-acetylmuramoyl-pentapeptide-transferase|uniref:Phospho-N-acetylmuramoyl-pentapeptide-transferase n=1 Tax=Megasphaera hexanoica TaxID=1675036 RepID=A0A848BSG3_9FIRM|nr:MULTISPECIES: phospho-N-acetylmuramoyl-pentapeptide-transferase [Megasphaera]MCI5531990.1 phospho-N-acetylmuramoyl-pentapeptide-transferase [Caecibacter massiliensis]HAM05118.1 phospho-N-acetylmuramoyl-pentapeptide-transferase [Megasphaera sp.]AXB80819.1 phospho-N-acetylmuramoyl-pentapeptide-transferase [Megasphaera hexanoica]KUH55964.1 phospho-N-acetylmuramoyl-pentapeptide-transferase [Megasphaera sp. DJF_B143]MDY2903860.1 phospho-N-acetylmuramoyl-pentapeptide-transferase [Caecibacter mass